MNETVKPKVAGRPEWLDKGIRRVTPTPVVPEFDRGFAAGVAAAAALLRSVAAKIDNINLQIASDRDRPNSKADLRLLADTIQTLTPNDFGQ